jgi:hypothetical protein
VGRECGGGTGDGGEELGLGEAEADAIMEVAEAVEFGDVEREVDVAEGGAGVVDVGQVGGGREGVGAGGDTGSKGAVEIGEDFVEEEEGKEGAEGASLREPFLLEKGGPSGSFKMEPAGVGGVIEHVEEGDEAAEGGVAAKDGATGFLGDGVEHVDDVKEEEGMCGGLASGL